MHNKKDDDIYYESTAKKKSDEFVKYYKNHPYKFIERYFGVKLTLAQKILMLIPTKEQLRQNKLDKLLKKYLNHK